MTRRLLLVLALAAVAGLGLYLLRLRGQPALVLTGVITTDEVRVSSLIEGRLQSLSVRPGDAVHQGQLLALIQPQELKADMAFFANTEQQSAAQVAEAEAEVKYLKAQTVDQVRQAEANLASADAQVAQAQADLENTQLNFQRVEGLHKSGAVSDQEYDQARTAFAAASAHVEALQKQARASAATLALARANSQQIAARQAAVQASTHQLAATAAQRQKAELRLGYTEIRAPIEGVVDVRAALDGEVVVPAQPILTLIDPDDLWVRADVEESYVDRIHLGDKYTVRLASGATRSCPVFFRGVDADYATQRDVSRTKRDIKTFEIRLRCDNRDRGLALGMTAYVELGAF